MSVQDKVTSYTTYGGGGVLAFMLDNSDTVQAIGIYVLVIGMVIRLIYDTVRFIERDKGDE